MSLIINCVIEITSLSISGSAVYSYHGADMYVIDEESLPVTIISYPNSEAPVHAFEVGDTYIIDRRVKKEASTALLGIEVLRSIRLHDAQEAWCPRLTTVGIYSSKNPSGTLSFQLNWYAAREKGDMQMECHFNSVQYGNLISRIQTTL